MSVRTRATSPGGGGAADTRGFSIVVAASNSLDPTLAPAAYRCDGVADHVEWNAANVALNAVGGGTAIGLNGTFVLDTATITGLTYVAIRGNGYGTLFFVANGVFINAITFTNANYWMVKDLRIDGNFANNPDQASDDNQNCIFQNLGDSGMVVNCWLWNPRRSCVRGTATSDGLIVEGCWMYDPQASGVTCVGWNWVMIGCWVYSANYGATGFARGLVTGNRFIDCAYGIVLAYNDGVAAGNMASGGNYGASISGNNNSLTGNTFYYVVRTAIYIAGNENTVSGNECHQNTDANYDGISIAGARNSIIANIVVAMLRDGIRLITAGADENLIFGNKCYNNAGYGINVSLSTCNLNRVRENDLRGNITGPYNDASLDTILMTETKQFAWGGNATGIVLAQFIAADGSAKGWEIDAADEWAIALMNLAAHVQKVVRIEVRAVGLAAPGAGNKMLMELLANGATYDEPWNTEPISVVNKISREINFAISDEVSWVFTVADDADIGDLSGGDSLEVKAKYNAVVGADIATDAVFRTVTVHYV